MSNEEILYICDVITEDPAGIDLEHMLIKASKIEDAVEKLKAYKSYKTMEICEKTETRILGHISGFVHFVIEKPSQIID